MSVSRQRRTASWSRRAFAAILSVSLGTGGTGWAAQERQVPRHPRELERTLAAFAAPDPDPLRAELAGGAVAYVVEDHALPLVEVAVAMRAGRYLEPPGKTGVATLAAVLMRSGGAGELGADQLNEAIDRLGADIDTGIGDLRGGARLSATTWTLDRALELFFDVLARPRFQPDRLATLKSNMLEGLTRRNENPLDVLEREWGWLLFGADHFLTRPPTAESVASIDRQDLLSFHRESFRPASLIFAVSGDVDREAILAKLRDALAAWPAVTSGARPWPPEPPAFDGRPGLFHVEADVPQAKVLIGHRAVDISERPSAERAAMELVNEILGGSGAISRIAGRLRTAEGLAYRASASYDLRRPWPTDFRVFFETENRLAARAIAAALQEIERLRTQRVHPQELEIAKQALLTSIRRSFESAEKTAGYLAEDELLGRGHDSWSGRYRALQAVTAEEVREAARRALRSDELVFLVVGRGAELGLGKSTNPFDTPELERVTGHRAERLPRRDPLTLEPRTSRLNRNAEF